LEGNQQYYQLEKAQMIRNNKAQSMITVMLLLMILGTIVTLIVSSTITDTRKLLVQKSYERAYSLSEQFLTKLVSGNVLGASLGDINGIFIGSNGADNCSIGFVGANSVSDYVSSVDLSCNRVGSNTDSIVNCTRTPEVAGKSLKIQTDEPVILDYSKRTLDYNVISSTNPKIYLIFKNSEAVQVSYKYEETIGGVVTPKSVSFIVSSNQNKYPGSILFPNGSNAPTVPTYPQSLVDIVNKPNSTVINKITATSDAVTATLSSVTGSLTEIKSMYIDLKNLATNIKIDNNHTAKSLEVKFLESTDFNTSPTIIDFAIHNEGFSIDTQKELAYQFHKFKCSAYDSAYDGQTDQYGGTGTTKGFGSARLEAYIPINKALPDFFDYSLFVGGGLGGSNPSGYPVQINK